MKSSEQAFGPLKKANETEGGILNSLHVISLSFLVDLVGRLIGPQPHGYEP